MVADKGEINCIKWLQKPHRFAQIGLGRGMKALPADVPEGFFDIRYFTAVNKGMGEERFVCVCVARANVRPEWSGC